MGKNKYTARSICLTCKGIIEFKRRHKPQELIHCPHCRQILEIVRVFPHVLDFPDDPYIPAMDRYHRRLS